jgi:hypothetical protein
MGKEGNIQVVAVHAVKAQKESRKMAPLILALAVDAVECSASSKGRFCPGKSPRHPFIMRLSRPQSRSSYFGEQKKSPH